MKNKRKLFLKWNAVTKTAAAIFIGLLGSLSIHAQTLPPLHPPNPNPSGPVLSEYERESNYGYEEGKRFASRKDRLNYETFLRRYYDGLRMYPEDATFYRARFEGLTAGWMENQPAPDLTLYKKLKEALERDPIEI